MPPLNIHRINGSLTISRCYSLLAEFLPYLSFNLKKSSSEFSDKRFVLSTVVSKCRLHISDLNVLDITRLQKRDVCKCQIPQLLSKKECESRHDSFSSNILRSSFADDHGAKQHLNYMIDIF
ncbi:unnamed protein product [Albugo candida]|uniref:Uncharacterized protein n=1 Tax=Albugo candida TaxID=65357 RepID=A0A024FWB3_9STRA|nr:unnamed protein product [Albugo candida]|eukprot:CCI11405.1 unnamed protein product [Albugo candida]